MQVQENVSVLTNHTASSNAATPFAVLVNASVGTADDVITEVVVNQDKSTLSERDHFVECLEVCGDCV